jgi:septum site-determining protein MinD
VLITRYDPAPVGEGEMLSIEDVLEILDIPLLGVVPESQEVLRASNLGARSRYATPQVRRPVPYCAAARRLKGEDLPMTVPREAKQLFGRLFSGGLRDSI